MPPDDTAPVLPDHSSPRYVFHCVADGVYGGPLPTDDLDEALLSTASYWGSHWDIYDTVKGKYVQGIQCAEDEADLHARLAARGSSVASDEQEATDAR